MDTKEMDTMDKFAQAGIDFIMAMRACLMAGWKTARGASYYFHGDNGFSIFMRGLGSGKLLAAQAIDAYGFDEQILLKIQAAAVGYALGQTFSKRRAEK